MSYLYLIECEGLHKIGIANDVRSRLAQLQTGNPFPLKVVLCFEFGNASPIEQSLHQKFSAKRHVGEWFELVEGDVCDLSGICAMLGGNKTDVSPATAESVDEAETRFEIDDSLPIDLQIEALIASGWRIEIDSRKDCATLRWRRDGEDKSVGLGRVTPRIEELAKNRSGRGNRINHGGRSVPDVLAIEITNA